MMSEAKRHLKKAGLSNEQITSEILTYQKSRATAIVTTATKYGYDTIVVGRRGLTDIIHKLRTALENQKELAGTDPLTSVTNRRAFYDLANLEFQKDQ